MTRSRFSNGTHGAEACSVAVLHEEIAHTFFLRCRLSTTGSGVRQS